MAKIWLLTKGEIKRLFRYKIIVFSVIVSLVWVLIIALADLAFANAFVPILVLMDSGLMSIIFLGASYYLEKQEGSIKSLVVTPARMSEILVSKFLSALFLAFISFVIVVGSALVFQDFHVNVGLMFCYMLLVVFSHTAIGYLIILNSRDFMQMLLKYMGVFLLLMGPMVLVALGLIPDQYDYLALISPSYAAQVAFNSTISAGNTGEVVFSVVYLFLIGAILYPFAVSPKYAKVVTEG